MPGRFYFDKQKTMYIERAHVCTLWKGKVDNVEGFGWKYCLNHETFHYSEVAISTANQILGSFPRASDLSHSNLDVDHEWGNVWKIVCNLMSRTKFLSRWNRHFFQGAGRINSSRSENNAINDSLLSRMERRKHGGKIMSFVLGGCIPNIH